MKPLVPHLFSIILMISPHVCARTHVSLMPEGNVRAKQMNSVLLFTQSQSQLGADQNKLSGERCSPYVVAEHLLKKKYIQLDDFGMNDSTLQKVFNDHDREHHRNQYASHDDRTKVLSLSIDISKKKIIENKARDFSDFEAEKFILDNKSVPRDPKNPSHQSGFRDGRDVLATCTNAFMAQRMQLLRQLKQTTAF